MVLSEKKLSVVDLFCGAGGFSAGFSQAGFNIIAGVDIDAAALRSFKANNPGAQAIQEDLLSPDAVTYYLKDVDVLIGSPPCQDWSIGKNTRRKYNDDLIKAFYRAVELIRPRFYCWECAKETLSYPGSPENKILDAYLFGAPQIRKRAFHSNFKLPSGSTPGKSLNELFAWAETKVLFNHRSLNENAFSPVYLSNRPARTAVTWPIRIYKEGVFTVEMMSRVQGFPDGYIFEGTQAEKYRQIGNAVSPVVSKAVAEALVKVVSL